MSDDSARIARAAAQAEIIRELLPFLPAPGAQDNRAARAAAVALDDAERNGVARIVQDFLDVLQDLLETLTVVPVAHTGQEITADAPVTFVRWLTTR